MARRKDSAAPKSPPPDQINVKVERGLHRKLKMLATGRDMDLTEYLDALLRRHVDEEFPKFLREQS